MTITLSLPVLATIVFLAVVAGASMMLIAVWVLRVSARVSTLEAILNRQHSRAPTSSEMAVMP